MINHQDDSVIEMRMDLCIYLEDACPRSVSWHVLSGNDKELTTLQITIGDTCEPDLRKITQPPQELADWINERLEEGWQLLGGNFGIPELKGLISPTDEDGRLIK